MVILRNKISYFGDTRHQQVINLLLFLLPIFAVSMRHWLSYLFGVLAIYSISTLFKKSEATNEIQKEEEILLWIFGFYFIVFLITSLVNGWGAPQTRYMGVEIRYLVFIPVYLAVRQVPNATKWLLLGILCAVCFTFVDSFVAVVLLDDARYLGAYGPLFAGPVTVMMASFLMYKYWDVPGYKGVSLQLGIAVLATVVIIFANARNAYFALPLFIFLALLNNITLKKLPVILVSLFIAVVLFSSIERVNSRFIEAYKECRDYSAYKNPQDAKRDLKSIGVRLEMWRTTRYFFQDAPIFGIGRGNYTEAAKKYVKLKKAHRNIAMHAHPHNAYSEMIISKGLLGVLVFIGVTIFPLLIFVRRYKAKNSVAMYGILLTGTYLFFSLTDASTFIKGNYVSLYVVLIAVFFSQCVSEHRSKMG